MQRRQPAKATADKAGGASSRRGGRTAVRLNLAPRSAALPETIDGEKPKKGRRSDDVRERVLKSALECFGMFGFEGTSTRAVAERAGVTHTLVLYHFESKDQLWKSTMEFALGTYMAGIMESLDTSTELPAADALRIFIDQFVRMSAQVPQIHRIMTMESNQGTDRLQWVIDNYLYRHFCAVRDLIRRGQMEGTVRECDPARLYYHIIGAAGTPFTISTEYRQFTGRDVFSEAEILRTIAFIYEIVFI